VASHWNDNAHGVRRLGFGVTGPHGAPLVSARQTADLIQRAFELGIRFFDTGPSYGAGEAERRLGEAMQRLPRVDCIISTKVGITASGLTARHRDFTPDGVRRSLDASLSRLRDTRIDWLFLHGASPVELTDGLFKTLEELRYWGRVGAVGYCGRDRYTEVALRSGQFSLVMTPVHLGLAPEDRERNARILGGQVDVIGIEALTPSLARFPAPLSAGAVWRLARRVRDGAPETPDPTTPRPSPSDCLRWALSEGGAKRVVITTSQISHLEANAAAAEALIPRAAP
jgi:aryl-alcohol dehydrogenase-like predicted oxidoreductase